MTDVHSFPWECGQYGTELADRYWLGPAVCGDDNGPMTSSQWEMTCPTCRDLLGLVPVDDRTDEQKERELAGYLWQQFTGVIGANHINPGEPND